MIKAVMFQVICLLLFISNLKTVSAMVREKRDSLQQSEITVTLKIEWNVTVVEKPNPDSFTTKVTNGTVLVAILNKAADANKFGPFNKYKSIYYSRSGYSITAMNGTKGGDPNNTYWRIFDEQTGGVPRCGMSFYVPADNSTTIFRFTQASGDGGPVSGYCKPPAPSGEIPSPITVTIGLEWNVLSVGRPIPAPFTTQVAERTVLKDIMNKAADEGANSPFNRYKTTYFSGLGRFINSMDGIDEVPENSTYWLIYDNKTGNLTPLGMDQYKPSDGSVTVFRLSKTGASHEETTSTSETTETSVESSGYRSFGIGALALSALVAIERLLV